MDEKESVLIVDDDKNTCKVLTFMLEKKGYEIETAGTGQEAIEKARGRFFNAALLDIRLPDVKGVDLVAPLREMHPDMAVIMVTGHASLETAVRALNEGASAYITKPLNMNEVLAALRQALEKQRLVMENRRLFQEVQRELAERKRAKEEAQRRAAQAAAHVEELAVLNELGQALTTRLNVEQVLDAAYRGASRLMDTTNFYIVLYNPDEDEITFALDVIEGKIQKSYVTYRVGQGLAEYIIRSRAPLLIEKDLPERLKEMGIELLGRPALSWMGAPLIVGDRVLGMMAAVQSDAAARAYDEHDRDLLLSIANQTAIALQNAYLFEETQRRVTQLTLLNDVGGKIAAVLELDGVLERATRLTQETFGYHHVAIFTVDRERDEAVMRTRAGDFVLMFPPDHRLKLGQGMVGWVARHGETLLANDVNAEPRYVNFYPDMISTRSELSVPIRVGEEIVGVLDVQSPQRNGFGEDAVMAMETLANQIATAIDNARLYEAVRQELTERKRAEEALQQRNRTLAMLHRAGQTLTSTLHLDQVLITIVEEVRRLLNVVACSIWLTDPDTGELVCRQATGPQSETVHGWRLAPGEGLAGRVARNGESLIVPDTRANERHFKGVDQQTGLALRSILSAPLQVKEAVIGVLQVVDTTVDRFRPADLRLIESLAASAAIAIENARLYEAVQRELAERKRMEEQLRQQERLAAVGQLAGGIAHDFNNLLATIILYAQMPLGKHDLPPRVTHALETILKEAQRAAKLVQQILDFSRRSMMETRQINLNTFVKEITRMLERTIPEDIHLSLETGTEEYVVEADPTRIQQVVMNLALNAQDAMLEGGELQIGLSRVEVRPGEEPPVADMLPGEWICLAVSDTGTGMTEEVQAHLFEPFFTTKGPALGTGLGLAQVYGIVKQHEGHIGVETEAGQGSTFRVYLLACTMEEIETKAEKETLALPQGEGEMILLVEDAERLRKAMKEVLELLGYRVLTAAHGKEALEVYRATEEIDLVLTDLVMPVMGGKQLIQELRKEYPDLKALAITGYVMRVDRQELEEAGFLDVVHKPFSVDSLAQVLRRALDVD